MSKIRLGGLNQVIGRDLFLPGSSKRESVCVCTPFQLLEAVYIPCSGLPASSEPATTMICFSFLYHSSSFFLNVRTLVILSPL